MKTHNNSFNQYKVNSLTSQKIIISKLNQAKNRPGNRITNPDSRPLKTEKMTELNSTAKSNIRIWGRCNELQNQNQSRPPSLAAQPNINGCLAIVERKKIEAEQNRGGGNRN